jgi:hypothetical protein
VGGVWPPAPLPGVKAITLAQLEFPFDQRTAEPVAYLTLAEGHVPSDRPPAEFEDLRAAQDLSSTISIKIKQTN